MQLDAAVENDMNTGSIPSADRPEPVRILAALDALDATSADSNERIISDAAQLAKRVDGELHVVSAYPTFAYARSHQVERYLPALRVKARDRRRCAIRQLLRGLHVEATAIHVEEGALSNAIDAVASRLNAVVVIGTSAAASRIAISSTAPAAAATLKHPALPTEFAA